MHHCKTSFPASHRPWTVGLDQHTATPNRSHGVPHERHGTTQMYDVSGWWVGRASFTVTRLSRKSQSEWKGRGWPCLLATASRHNVESADVVPSRRWPSTSTQKTSPQLLPPPRTFHHYLSIACVVSLTRSGCLPVCLIYYSCDWSSRVSTTAVSCVSVSFPPSCLFYVTIRSRFYLYFL